MLFGCFFNSHFVFVSGKHISFLNACAFGFAVISLKWRMNSSLDFMISARAFIISSKLCEICGTFPQISPIFLTGRSYTNTFTLSTSSAAKGTRAAGTHLSFVSPKQQMFVYNGTDAAVKDLKSAEVNGEIVLNVNLALNGLSSAIATIDKATINLPGYLQISTVNGNGNGVPMVNGSKITVENVSTSRALQLTIKAKKLDFANQDAYGKVVIGNNGSIKMDGYFDLGIEANITGVPTSALSIGANVTVNDIYLKSATGIFDPEINISSLGDVAVTGVPDFLSEDGVRADLDNSQIILSIHNDMDAAAKVSAKVISTKNGQNLATVQLPEMHMCQATRFMHHWHLPRVLSSNMQMISMVGMMIWMNRNWQRVLICVLLLMHRTWFQLPSS